MAARQRSCKMCGAKFRPRKADHWWCSERCYHLQWGRRNKSKRMMPRKCAMCEAWFTPEWKRGVRPSTCSPECRKRKYDESKARYRRRLGTGGKTIRVYEIRFRTGAVYVGQARNVAERMAGHRHERMNKRLGDALWIEREPEVVVVGEYKTPARADSAESRRIAERRAELGDRLLNVTAGPVIVRKGRSRVRDDKPVRCRICREWKAAADYQTDRSRSSGISSKCRSCANHIGMQFHWAKKKGECTSAAYYAAIAEIRDRREMA